MKQEFRLFESVREALFLLPLLLVIGLEMYASQDIEPIFNSETICVSRLQEWPLVMNMLVFLHIPKTAGTSFRFILERSCGLSHCHSGHNRKRLFSGADLNLAKRIFPRLRSIAGHNLVDARRVFGPDAFYMTFLRN